jgi:hypothetical protein
VPSLVRICRKQGKKAVLQSGVYVPNVFFVILQTVSGFDVHLLLDVVLR